jgi:hypothetical protein
MSDTIIPIAPSTIETIDLAFYNWLNYEMDIYSTFEDGWKKVPVIWVSAERAHQIKANKDIRDSSGMLKFPLISIERKTINKDPTKTGSVPANIRPTNDYKGGAITISRRINQEKTSNFANADQVKRTTLEQTETRENYRRNNKVYPLNFGNRNQRKPTEKVVYQTMTIPVPVHVAVTYQINIRTDFQQQLNEITTPFFTKNGNTRYIKLTQDKHNYDAFIKGDFNFENNASNLNEERKNYSTSINVEVIGYLIGEDKNQETPKVVFRENAVEVKVPREKIIVGDIPDFLNTSKNKTSYRE